MESKNKSVILLIIVAVIAIVIFTKSKDKSETVPDSIIENEVAEILSDANDVFAIRNISDISYDWTVEHNPDKDTHTDEVYINFELAGQYGKETHRITAVYQYYKENDLWEIVERSKSVVTEMAWGISKVEGQIFDGIDNDYTWVVVLDDVDVPGKTARVNYSIAHTNDDGTYTNIADDTVLTGMKCGAGFEIQIPTDTRTKRLCITFYNPLSIRVEMEEIKYGDWLWELQPDPCNDRENATVTYY